MSAYFDYRFKFPVTGLALALTAIGALRSAGLLGSGELPENMLGDYRDNSGATVDPATGTVTWCGREGVADAASYYIHIRSVVDPATLPFNPAIFGLTASDTAESAAVLGVWA